MRDVKGITFKMTWIAVLAGVSMAAFSPLMFFNLTHSQALYIIYPIAAIFIGLLAYSFVKEVWAGPVVILIGGFISAVTFSYLSSWIWIIIYAISSLLGSFSGVGIQKLKYPKIKITFKVLISICGVLLTMISLLYFSFFLGMTPDKSEEKKVITQAEEYLKTEYPNGNYKIYDVLYDNMGNFDQFEYAAKVRKTDDGEEFLVYFNENAGQMENSLKYADEFYN